MDVQLAKEVMIRSRRLQENSTLPGFRKELGMNDNVESKRGGDRKWSFAVGLGKCLHIPGIVQITTETKSNLPQEENNLKSLSPHHALVALETLTIVCFLQ